MRRITEPLGTTKTNYSMSELEPKNSEKTKQSVDKNVMIFRKQKEYLRSKLKKEKKVLKNNELADFYCLSLGKETVDVSIFSRLSTSEYTERTQAVSSKNLFDFTYSLFELCQSFDIVLKKIKEIIVTYKALKTKFSKLLSEEEYQERVLGYLQSYLKREFGYSALNILRNLVSGKLFLLPVKVSEVLYDAIKELEERFCLFSGFADTTKCYDKILDSYDIKVLGMVREFYIESMFVPIGELEEKYFTLARFHSHYDRNSLLYPIIGAHFLIGIPTALDLSKKSILLGLEVIDEIIKSLDNLESKEFSFSEIRTICLLNEILIREKLYKDYEGLFPDKKLLENFEKIVEISPSRALFFDVSETFLTILEDSLENGPTVKKIVNKVFYSLLELEADPNEWHSNFLNAFRNEWKSKIPNYFEKYKEVMDHLK